MLVVPIDPDELVEPPDPIIPKTRPAFIEMVVVGLRNLAPYKYQNMVSPFLEIEPGAIADDMKHDVTRTKHSRKPSPSNPNFLERFVIETTLPQNPIFAQPLFIRAIDIRLGGFLKPVVGVGVIDMASKIPGSKSYIPPQELDMYIDKRGESKAISDGTVPTRPKSHREIESDQIGDIRHHYEETLEMDDYIGTAQAPNVEGFIKSRMAVEDTGAGLFGALTHVDLTQIEEARKRRGLYDPNQEVVVPVYSLLCLFYLLSNLLTHLLT